jgi:biopolymer transport protein ExbD
MMFVENAVNFIIDQNHCMAQMEWEPVGPKKTRRRYHPPFRIDMTPMVDLGFLLITFFIFTTTMTERKAMKLFMPDDKDSTVLGESKVLTVLLGENSKAVAYEGKLEDAVRGNRIIPTSFSEKDGIGNLIRKKQKQLTSAKEGKESLVFLIKPTARSSYKNVIDALDETLINGVKKYMIIAPSAEERSVVEKLNP